MPNDPKTNEWNLLKQQVDALLHDKNVSADSIEEVLDVESGPGSTKLMPPGSQIPVDRTAARARSGSATQRPEAGRSGAQSAGRQRAHVVAGSGVPGSGGHAGLAAGQDVVVHRAPWRTTTRPSSS